MLHEEHLVVHVLHEQHEVVHELNELSVLHDVEGDVHRGVGQEEEDGLHVQHDEP